MRFLMLIDLVTRARGKKGKEDLWKLPSSQGLLAENYQVLWHLPFFILDPIIFILLMASIFSFFFFIANSLLQCFYTYFIFRAVRLPQRVNRHLLRKLSILPSVTMSLETASTTQEPAAWEIPWPSPEAAPLEGREQTWFPSSLWSPFPSAHLAQSQPNIHTEQRGAKQRGKYKWASKTSLLPPEGVKNQAWKPEGAVFSWLQPTSAP